MSLDPTPAAATPPTMMSAAAWREARALVRAQRRTLGLGLALVVVNRSTAMAMPLASRYLVDEVIGHHRGTLLLPLAVATAAAVVVEGASGYVASQVVGVGAERAVAAVRASLQAHLVRLPVAAFDRESSGALVERVMADVDQVRGLAGRGLVQLAGGALSALLAAGLLVTLDAPLTVAVVALIAVAIWAGARGLDRVHGAFGDVGAAYAALAGRLLETVLGVRVVKAYAAERGEVRAFRRAVHRLLRAAIRAQRGVSALAVSATALGGAVGLLVLVGGGRAVLAGAMTLGDLVMYVFAAGLLTAPVLQLAAGGADAGKALAALGRIGALREIATEDAEDAARGATAVTRPLGGAIAFDRVSYAYVPGRPALYDVELAILTGSTTALVGRSGAGKSTLCHLLLAYDRPTRGRVLVDGRDLASLRRADYRRQVGLVPQDGFLFDASLADNIRLARPGATPAEVRAAAAAAHCDEFAERLPQGYATTVGERGIALSGGQRQRVAIARALLADPRILVLDEATSHLDAESEALVRAALRALRRGRTTIVVAHRLAIVEEADQVVVLERGRVVGHGTPAMLRLDAGVLGPYGRLLPRDASTGDSRAAYDTPTVADRWPAMTAAAVDGHPAPQEARRAH